MSCKPCASGASGPWNKPVPGNVIVVPVGSTVVDPPDSAPCSAEQTSTAGSVSGATTQSGAAAAACPSWPVVQGGFIAPSVQGMAQVSAKCAASWAIPGMSIWIAPIGYLEVAGVSGDLLTLRNLSVPAGTQIQAGTPMVYGASTTDLSSLETVEALDAVVGVVGGRRVIMRPKVGHMIAAVQDPSGKLQWACVPIPE